MEATQEMNWILIAYLLGLIFISAKLNEGGRAGSLGPAWVFLAIIPIWQFVMDVCRAANLQSLTAVRLIEVVGQAAPSLFLGISMLCLGRALADRNPAAGNGGE